MKPISKLRDSQFEAKSETTGRNAWRSRATEDLSSGWQPSSDEDQWLQVIQHMH